MDGRADRRRGALGQEVARAAAQLGPEVPDAGHAEQRVGEGDEQRCPGCAALMAAYVERQVSMYASILDVGAAVGRLALTAGARIVDYVAAATGLTADELRAAGRSPPG